VPSLNKGFAFTKTFIISGMLMLSACSGPIDSSKTKAFESTYSPNLETTTLITNAKIIDGTGSNTFKGSICIHQGRIKVISVYQTVNTIQNPTNINCEYTNLIDAKNKYVTPGIIDVHSHLGNYPTPSVSAHNDGNEITSPITSEVYAEHGVWPQDPGFDEALKGGVTTLHILPGSANLFGGRGVTLRNYPSRTVQGMKFPKAPYTLKMACGENPKRVYGDKGGPGSRMGNFAGYRQNWIRAQEYRKNRNSDQRNTSRNLQLETLADVLDGEILVQMHCYRADEMVQILDLAKEFDYKVTAFHHAVEAYKIGDILKENDTCAAMWADWYGFKMESYDGILENIPFVHESGACAMIHSDSGSGIQRLNQEVAKTWAHGNRAGLNIKKEDAWKWLTSNPARALGILDQTGTLEKDKRADIIIWNEDPFSTYARPEKVFLDGQLLFDKQNNIAPKSDFRLGYGAQ